MTGTAPGLTPGAPGVPNSDGAGDGETVVHQMITERQHAGMHAGHLGDQHHAGPLALAVDVVGEAGRGERRGGPSGQIGFRSRLAGDFGSGAVMASPT